MKEIALPTTDFAENAGMTVSRVFAVLWCIAQNIYRKGEQRTMKMIENEMNVTVPLEIIKASEIEPKEVKWLWYPYIPFGKVTLLQGDPGDGKSKLMLSIAALLSNGEPLPFTDEEETEPMTIIYQTTEDDADDTVVPRFNSAGGNGENLIFIKEDEKSLSFGDNRIAEAIEKYHAKLLILDPMSSYIGENCSMNNANETRAEFNHLIAVAKNTGCAIVIIAHMNKMRDTNPLYRTNGSIDIAGAARSILAITRSPNKEAPAERYMVQVKSNLAPTGSVVLVYKCRQKKLNSLYYKKKEQRRCSTWRKIKNRILRNSSSRSSISTMPEVPHILNWNMNMA